MSDRRGEVDVLGDVLKSMRDVREKLGPPPPSPFDFLAPWPVYTSPAVPEDRMFLFSRPLLGLALLAHPRHYASVSSICVGGDEGVEELRCGPFTSPDGSQWAVVMDTTTRRRKVVDWPRPYPDMVRPRRSA